MAVVAAAGLLLVVAAGAGTRGDRLPVAAADGVRPAEERSRARLTEHPSGRRLAALVAAVNSGDSAAIARFGAEHYDDRALAETGGTARLLSRWLEVRETFGPIAIDSVVSTSTHATTAWALGTVSRAWLNLRMVVDSAPPHRVRRISLGRGLTPPYASVRRPKVTPGALPRTVRTYLERLAAEGLFSGVVVVTGPEGDVFSGAYGTADRRTGSPNTLDTPFDVASVGKTFTAVALGTLLEDGKLRLEDSLGAHLAGLPPRLRRLTLAQLLEHSSGLGELGAGLDSAMRRASSVSEMLPLLRDSTVAFEPGTSFAYSNRGYILLGAVVERASGSAYARYVATRIWAPLGMRRTTLGVLPPDRAHRYSRFPTLRSSYVPGEPVEFDPAHDLSAGPHGGAYSTARDLARFAAALREGRVLKPSTVARLTNGRAGHPWAMGFMLGGDAGGRRFGHAGGTPGMSSALWVYPATGYALVILSNDDSGASVAASFLTELLAHAVR